MASLKNSIGAIPVSNPIPVQAPSIPEDGVRLVELTPELRSKWDDTMSYLMWKAPGMQHLLYKLLNAQGNTPSDYVALMSYDVPIAATDGRYISVNPDTFFKMRLPERGFVLAHEVAHNARGDVEMLHRLSQRGSVPMNDGTSLPFDNDAFQQSMDAVINAWLIESEIGEPPPGSVYDDTVTGSDSVLDVYPKYYKEHPDGAGPGGFDKVTKPGALTGKDPNSAAGARNPDQWKAEMETALTLEKMKRHGDVPASMKRFFSDLLEPKIAWQDHIQMLINRVVGDGSLRWDVPHPYLGNAADGDQYFVPSPTGFGAGWIVFWMDTSGSRSEEELLDAAAEVVGIIEIVNPERLTVIWNDASIDFVDEIKTAEDMQAIRARGVGGGGGTDYEPVLDWIRDNPDGAPDLFIGFTDGYVGFPDRPHKFPTIWASSTDVTYPFGEVVRIENKRPVEI